MNHGPVNFRIAPASPLVGECPPIPQAGEDEPVTHSLRGGLIQGQPGDRPNRPRNPEEPIGMAEWYPGQQRRETGGDGHAR